MSSIRKTKQNGVMFKIDFEKAHDKVKCPFRFQSLKMKGFSAKWISWIKSFLMGGSVVMNINDDVGHFFSNEKRSSTRRPPFPDIV
jgi:hypothetical protein